MEQHLDYVADMGYTMIWPTPLLESDMPAVSYHGYAPTSHYRIDPRYGSNEDYQRFVAAAAIRAYQRDTRPRLPRQRVLNLFLDIHGRYMGFDLDQVGHTYNALQVTHSTIGAWSTYTAPANVTNNTNDVLADITGLTAAVKKVRAMAVAYRARMLSLAS